MAGFHHAAPNSKRRNEDAPQESHDTDEQQKVLLIGLGILLNKGGILWHEQLFICFWYYRFDACWIHGDTLQRRRESVRLRAFKCYHLVTLAECGGPESHRLSSRTLLHHLPEIRRQCKLSDGELTPCRLHLAQELTVHVIKFKRYTGAAHHAVFVKAHHVHERTVRLNHSDESADTDQLVPVVRTHDHL